MHASIIVQPALYYLSYISHTVVNRSCTKDSCIVRNRVFTILAIVNNLGDSNLNEALRTLELLGGVVRLGSGLYSYLWYSNTLPKILQVMMML